MVTLLPTKISYCFPHTVHTDVDINSKGLFTERTDVRKENSVVFRSRPELAGMLPTNAFTGTGAP